MCIYLRANKQTSKVTRNPALVSNAGGSLEPAGSRQYLTRFPIVREENLGNKKIKATTHKKREQNNKQTKKMGRQRHRRTGGKTIHPATLPPSCPLPHSLTRAPSASARRLCSKHRVVRCRAQSQACQLPVTRLPPTVYPRGICHPSRLGMSIYHLYQVGAGG